MLKQDIGFEKKQVYPNYSLQDLIKKTRYHWVHVFYLIKNLKYFDFIDEWSYICRVINNYVKNIKT